jgi:hypothetical protein
MAQQDGEDIMSSILCNPYHYCGAVIARAGVCLATALWAALILVIDDALVDTSYGPTITKYIHEDIIGGIFLFIAVGLFWRLYKKSPPHWSEVVGYAILFFWWLAVECFVIFASQRFVLTLISSGATVLGLALYAFVALPKRGGYHCAAAGD